MRKLVLAALLAAATVSGVPAAQAAECNPWNPFNPQCWCQISEDAACTAPNFEAICQFLGSTCDTEGLAPAG